VPIRVYDFFSGCGGTSAGLEAAGLQIVLGLDIEPDARDTFQTNFPEAAFICEDIRNVSLESITPHVHRAAGDRLLFSCCAPCQPFSILNRKKNRKDARALLLYEFARFVEYFLPEFIFLENVPGLQNISGGPGPVTDFERVLKLLNYNVAYGVIESQRYGIPQRRKRFVLIASLLGPIALPAVTHGPGTANPDYPTVWETIGDLPPIAAGETHPEVPNHRAAGLSDLLLRRIMATPEGGGRLDWPEELVLDCHSGDYDGHTDVYGRMRKHEPASGLTTRCTSLSNGRFGHPEQHRAISVREAACLQTFPRNFIFSGGLNSMARQIGNAVPVLVAQVFGEHFITHSELY
jgi:DNA (cytosine-5)-methyltransferase 1